MKKRILSMILSIVMVVGLMPTVSIPAFAAADTGKAIQLVDSGTAANIGGGQADSIYFGTYKQSSDGNNGYNVDPIKWRVLSNADGKLFLLSDQNLDVFEYHKEYESVTWETSTMRSWLNGLAANQGSGDTAIDYTDGNFLDTAFSPKDQAAIADTEVVNDDNTDYSTEGGNNTTDKVFLLSITEARNTSYFADDNSRIATNTAYVAGGGEIGTSDMYSVGNADYWWLRSPCNPADSAAYVNNYGSVISHGNYVNFGSSAVRPAFNLNLNYVLFTSAAVGGKADTVDTGLTAVTDYAGNEWKLTLKDSSHENFTLAGVVKTENNYAVSYSGAKTGDNEYISVMIADSTGAYTHYGRVGKVGTSDSGTVSFDLSGIDMTGKTLYVFNEQYNGDYKTDYASELKEVAVYAVTVSATPTEGGTVSGGGTYTEGASVTVTATAN